jgi:hypothetical protein
MKNYCAYIFTFIFLISCVKKEEKKDTDEVTEPKTEKTIQEHINVVKEVPQLVFTVQIAAIVKENSKLANMKDIQIFYENGLHKYRLGRFKTYQEARIYRKHLRFEDKQFSDAFVQALKNKKPIHIKEALAN